MNLLHTDIHGIEKRGLSGARGTAPYIDGPDSAVLKENHCAASWSSIQRMVSDFDSLNCG